MWNGQISYIDVLVDGTYVAELHSPKLKWKGSANQRVIDVPKSLKENKLIVVELHPCIKIDTRTPGPLDMSIFLILL